MARSRTNGLILVTFLAAGSLFVVPTAALATDPVGNYSYYVDAPPVQGSYVAGTTENFNAGCSTTWPGIGTTDVACDGLGASTFGGASTESSAPTTGGTGTPFASVWADTSMTLSLTTPSTYFGIWWSAGDGPNTLQFYSGDTLVSTFTFYSLVDALSHPTLNGVSGATYATSDYFGNPVDRTNTGEPYAYLHVFAPAGETFDKVVFSETGGGFEFDNVTVASTTQHATDSLVNLAGPGESSSTPAPEATVDPTLATTGMSRDVLGILSAGAVLIVLSGVFLVIARRRLARS